MGWVRGQSQRQEEHSRDRDRRLDSEPDRDLPLLQPKAGLQQGKYTSREMVVHGCHTVVVVDEEQESEREEQQQQEEHQQDREQEQEEQAEEGWSAPRRIC